jgi:hypothetical protein
MGTIYYNCGLKRFHTYGSPIITWESMENRVYFIQLQYMDTFSRTNPSCNVGCGVEENNIRHMKYDQNAGFIRKNISKMSGGAKFFKKRILFTKCIFYKFCNILLYTANFSRILEISFLQFHYCGSAESCL